MPSRRCQRRERQAQHLKEVDPVAPEPCAVLPTWAHWSNQVHKVMARHLPRVLRELVWHTVGQTRDRYLVSQVTRRLIEAVRFCEYALVDLIDESIARGQLVFIVTLKDCMCPCPAQLWHTHRRLRKEVIRRLCLRFRSWYFQDQDDDNNSLKVGTMGDLTAL